VHAWLTEEQKYGETERPGSNVRWSCSTYRVGKVQSIFSLPVNKKLFRYSVFHVLPTPMDKRLKYLPAHDPYFGTWLWFSYDEEHSI